MTTDNQVKDMISERRIAEQILLMFSETNCRVDQGFMWRSLALRVYQKLNPIEQDIFNTVYVGLQALQYMSVDEDGKFIRLQQRGFELIYDKSKIESIRITPWVIPAHEEQQNWDAAYTKMWNVIGQQKNNPYYVRESVFYEFVHEVCIDLPPTYAQYIESVKTVASGSASSEVCYKNLLDHLSWEKRYEVYVKVQIYIEDVALGKKKIEDTTDEDLNCESETCAPTSNIKNPVVTISYSWDSESHKGWVRDLADKLIGNGVNVKLDQYETRKGSDLDFFMEDSFRKSDRVICIMTPNYKLKTENLTGGVGEEYSIIKGELYKDLKSCKYIPVLRSGSMEDSAPDALYRRDYVSMTDADDFEKEYEVLLRDIFNKPKYKKPKLGSTPNFDK